MRADIDAARSTAAIEDVADLDINYYDHVPLSPRVWDLRRDLSAYDGLYLALAEALDAPLLTADAALASAPGHRASVVVLRATAAGD